MTKFLLTLGFILTVSTSFAQDVWVNSYARTDGSVVQGHYRTHSDQTVNNNFTTVGNTNPYTGKVGTLPRDSGYPVQSLSNYSPTSYTPVSNNNSSYTISVTTSLNGGYGVAMIIEQVLESGKWKTIKEDGTDSYLFFDKNLVGFKRGQNKWLVRDQIFVEYNSQAKVYIYNSEYGLSLLDEGLRFIIFYDASNKTKRYLYVIGKATPSIIPTN